MSSLLRKSLRDLKSYRGQALCIALLVAVVSLLVTGGVRARGMLQASRDVWYERLAFADLELLFQPTHKGLAEIARKVDGIRAAEERLLAEGLIEAEGLRPLPALLQILPVPAPRLNRLHLLAGRYPRKDEAALVIDRSLQVAHGISLGSILDLRVDEEERTLPVVGIAFSPEHVLFPINPEYTMPLAGTVAVIGVSEAAARGIRHAGRVNSLLLRLEPGGNRAAVQQALEQALPVAIAESVSRAERPGHAFTEQILATYDIYMPATALVIVLIALALLVLTLVRIVQRQRVLMGTLVTLGHGPSSIASSFLAISLLPTAAGALLGGAVSGPFARTVFSSYARKVGYAPPIDPGAGSVAWLTAACCLLTALLACFVPALMLARHRPAALLARGTWRGIAERQGPLVRLAARLRDLLRVPLPVVLGLTHVVRRRGSTLAAVLGLGAIFAVVLAFLLVHVTHRREIGASIDRMGLDATVHFTEPVDDAAIADLGRRAGGEAEALLSRRAVLQLGDRTLVRRLLCARPGRWMNKLHMARGRKLLRDNEPAILIDQFLAGLCDIDVGDEIVCYPYKNAPEGRTLRVVGVLEGVGLGLAVLPLETGRDLFALPGLATGAHVASPLPAADLEQALWEAPGAEAVFSLARAGVQVRAIFEGSTIVLILALLMAILVAVLFLGVLAALDTTERAPDFAVLTAIGWRQRSILGLCLTEVMTRGILALALAVPLSPWLAGWLLDRIAAANHYRMQLATPAWLFIAVVGAALLLMPLGVLPAVRAARRVTPARALRLLAAE